LKIAYCKQLAGFVGQLFPPSDRVEITQDRIVRFAEITGDDNWYHLDTERAA